MNEIMINRYTFESLNGLDDNDYFSTGKIAVTTDKNAMKTLLHMHSHDYYELAYISDGEGIQIINDATYIVQKGDVIFFRLSDHHTYTSLRELEVINVCFRPDALPDINLLDDDPNAAIVLHLTESEQIEFETLLYMLRGECGADSGGIRRDYADEASQNYLNLLMIFLRRIGYMRKSRAEKETEKRWGALLQYILREYKTVTLGEAAQGMYLSKNYFCRMFKKTFGVTFLDYVDSIRLHMAKELLTTTDIPISEIRNTVGFTQSKRFHALFRRETGMTPLQYRKLYTTENGGD